MKERPIKDIRHEWLEDCWYPRFRNQEEVTRDQEVPCSPTCMSHVTHPCERCGLQWGTTITTGASPSGH
jgi:hypothetical protein